MNTHIKTNFLFYTFTLLICFNSFFLINADAQIGESASDTYTFETIDVEGVEFLALTASSDFEDYAGYTKSADGEKDVAFTLIDGVFATYEFPGAQNTYFFALGNNGNAAGHYEDSEGLFHGVVLEDGELRQYDFPDAVETFLYGISDTTGALTGNFIDAEGVRRGFSGDEIIEVPGASETFADFVNSSGGMVGSYVDAEGLYHPYVRTPNGRFVPLDLPDAPNLEYFFVHGINDARVVVARTKQVDSFPGTLVGTFQDGLKEFKVPDSVSTEGYNINQDGSVVGHYDSADGRRHGFIARPIMDTAAPVEDQPVPTPVDLNYTFESIDVPGVDFLALTASSDFEDYAGYTKSADGEKDVAFTLIDGVFTTYDFPGSQNTYFFALGNDGQAAGHYQDSAGLYHGVVLEDGELQQYDFPDAVETEIYGISDATGALTGNFTDASGVRRGFSADEIIEAPEASATYADFVNASGRMVGSYIDADGIYHPYMRSAEGRFISLDLPQAAQFEYFFVHGINDVGVLVGRSKRIGGVPRTSVGSLQHGLKALMVPGSISTEGWNINQDGSVVGHYDSADGRRHGFIARPVDAAESSHFGNTYTVTLSKGLNMLSVPLAPPTPVTAKSLVAMAGATTIIRFDASNQKFVAWTPDAPNDGFPIEGGQGYIVNVPATRNFAFVGAPWTDPTETTEAAAAPTLSTELPQEAWAFVVSGNLEGKPAFDGYQVIVRNLRTNRILTTAVQGDYFAAATADLARRSVVQVGDVIELRVIGPSGNAELQPLTYKVTPEHLANAVLSVRLDDIGKPAQDLLLQNYPNPFNPETWIPYQLSEDSLVSISIYDTTGRLIRTLSLGLQSAGFYNSQGRAAYWDGRNALGERVASGIYFYQLTTPSFQQTRRLVIVK
ncbi:MAG: T9SS type A sorting domain-containing protein [Candidatus Poribacteria bacterium]|nr:T9SS type A sorting domain-containing protein [Candidatus Poribacteria bacterium]